MKNYSDSNIHFMIIKVFIIIFILLLSISIINYIFNGFEITITIKDKYSNYYRHRQITYYTVVDTNNNIYNVNNSWFNRDFNKAEEDYNLLNKGATYKVKGHGFKVDMLGVYPIIYNVLPA